MLFALNNAPPPPPPPVPQVPAKPFVPDVPEVGGLALEPAAPPWPAVIVFVPPPAEGD
jgi:hypothetical protein